MNDLIFGNVGRNDLPCGLRCYLEKLAGTFAATDVDWAQRLSNLNGELLELWWHGDRKFDWLSFGDYVYGRMVAYARKRGFSHKDFPQLVELIGWMKSNPCCSATQKIVLDQYMDDLSQGEAKWLHGHGFSCKSCKHHQVKRGGWFHKDIHQCVWGSAPAPRSVESDDFVCAHFHDNTPPGDMPLSRLLADPFVSSRIKDGYRYIDRHNIYKYGDCKHCVHHKGWQKTYVRFAGWRGHGGVDLCDIKGKMAHCEVCPEFAPEEHCRDMYIALTSRAPR